jgi:hypothetical protein
MSRKMSRKKQPAPDLEKLDAELKIVEIRIRDLAINLAAAYVKADEIKRKMRKTHQGQVWTLSRREVARNA